MSQALRSIFVVVPPKLLHTIQVNSVPDFCMGGRLRRYQGHLKTLHTNEVVGGILFQPGSDSFCRSLQQL